MGFFKGGRSAADRMGKEGLDLPCKRFGPPISYSQEFLLTNEHVQVYGYRRQQTRLQF